MADFRTNIEVGAYGKFLMIEKKYKLPADLVAGKAAWLWHESQSELATHGTREQIVEWAMLQDILQAQQELWIEAFVRVGFLELDGDRYRIRGNETNIANAITFSERSAKGGEANRRRWERIKAQNEKKGKAPKSGELEAQPEAPAEGELEAVLEDSSMQGKATQGNSRQSKYKYRADFAAAFALYPVRSKGPKAEENFNQQIKTPEDEAALIAALKNYNEMLAHPDFSWRNPKSTFAAFLGSKSHGFFWRDFINWEPPKSKRQSAIDAWEERMLASDARGDA